MKAKCRNAAFIAALVSVICFANISLWATQTVETRKPFEVRLDTVWIAGTSPEELVFVFNNVIGYKSVESLRGAIANLPPGSKVTWYPRPLGAPPMPPEGMDDFRRFCAERKVELIVIKGE